MTSSDNSPESQLRLNKYVAVSLGVSRRQADKLIERGDILINNSPAKLGARISPNDIVSYNGKQITPKTYKLIALHKPTGYLCSRASQGGMPTIYRLLPQELSHLKPVGRLDKDTSGLILLTNDGDWSHQMTHPSFKKTKRYLATLNKPLQPLHRQMISDFGVDLPDGPSKLSLERQHEGDDTRWVIEMSEGRNRQIRRTFEALGYTVTKLHRTNFGNYSLGDIKRGEWQELDIS